MQRLTQLLIQLIEKYPEIKDTIWYFDFKEYADSEEELGINLITLFTALSCGAWEKQKDNVLNFDDCKLLYKRIQIGNNVHWLSNCGKTWALKKEDLQK